MAFDTGDDNGSETNERTETTDNTESVDSEVSVESGDKGTELVSNLESGLTGKSTELRVFLIPDQMKKVKFLKVRLLFEMSLLQLKTRKAIRSLIETEILFQIMQDKHLTMDLRNLLKNWRKMGVIH